MWRTGRRSARVAVVVMFTGALAAAAGIAGAATQRTFVASNGVDTATCTLSAPCRTFATAIANTLPGGEVIVLDSAGYGAATITQSVSIIAPAGIYAGISVFTGDGITIATPGLNVVLRGLAITGLGGQNGIAFLQGPTSSSTAARSRAWLTTASRSSPPAAARRSATARSPRPPTRVCMRMPCSARSRSPSNARGSSAASGAYTSGRARARPSEIRRLQGTRSTPRWRPTTSARAPPRIWRSTRHRSWAMRAACPPSARRRRLRPSSRAASSTIRPTATTRSPRRAWHGSDFGTMRFKRARRYLRMAACSNWPRELR